MKKVIVITGGRDYDDYPMVQEVLNFLNPTHVFEGGATGADEIAKMWCIDNKVPVTTINADWKKNGRKAGPLRNTQMLELAGPEAIVVAFPGGKGTENCVKTAISKNMIILRVEK